MPTNTPKLDLLRIQETWQFADEAFNRFIDDADNKLVGVDHLDSPKHWSDWKENTAYVKDDVVRITNTKSHQYYQCIVGGTSGATEPTNNVTGSVVTDGTVEWMVMSLSEAGLGGGTIQIWLSGWHYNRGDAVLYGTALYRCKIDHDSTDWNTDYIYWQEVFASIRLWQPNIYYFVDDTAIYDGLIYQCITAHKSDTTFSTTEEANWEIIGGAGGAKDWTSGVTYLEGQLVTVNGILYKSKLKHTSGTAFQSDIANWDIVYANIRDWQPGEYYPADTLIAYDDILYRCTTSHTATTNFYNDRANWKLFHNIIRKWQTDNYYETGQFVTYRDCLYRCNESHSTSSTPVTVNPSIWASGTTYAINDTVIEGTTLYRCKVGHVASTNFSDDILDWEFVNDLSTGITTWTTGTDYYVGDTVIYGGQTFTCTTYNNSTTFFNDISCWSTDIIVVDMFENNQMKWDLIYANIQDWTSNTYYKVGSIVLYNDVLFKCIIGHKSNVFSLETSNWKQIHKINAIVDDWQLSTQYYESQLVLHNNTLYRCKVDHISSSFEFIADDTKWDVVNANTPLWAVGIGYIPGDMVLYNNMLFRCKIAHTSIDFLSDASSWEILCGINEWTPNTTFHDGAIISYLGKIYRVRTAFTSGLIFSDTNLELLGGVGGIVDWTANTSYTIGQLILHDKIVYKATSNFVSGATFSDTNLEQITMGWTAYWQPYTYYTVGETVIHSNSIIRCAVAHTSLGTYNTSEATNWVIVASAQAIITYWTPNTDYVAGNAVIYNDILYICNVTHTSSADFNDDMLPGYEKWRTINTSATSGSWLQVTKLDVTAPQIVEIIINKTVTFLTAPVEVLKFQEGVQDETVNEFTFIAGDGQKFTVDGVRADTNKFVLFDGVAQLRTGYIYPMISEGSVGNGYVSVSTEIDLSEFKSVERLVVK